MELGRRRSGTTTEFESTNQNKFAKIIIRVSLLSFIQKKMLGIVVTLKGFSISRNGKFE